MNQFTHRVVMALAAFALAIATGSVETGFITGAAQAISSSSVLIEQQAAGVRFSVQDESTVALRLEVLSLDGRRIFQSEWQPDKTVIWPMASLADRIVANGVYLYAINVRNRNGHEYRKLGKLVLVQGTEPVLSVPAIGQLTGTEPSAAQFPLTAGTSWSQRLGTERSDTYRILRRPARLPSGPPTSFEQLFQLGADGKLRITALCLGTVFAPVTPQNPDNLSDEGDCRSNWSGTGGGGGGGISGWVDDGAIVRLATATDKVGIGTTSPSALFSVVNSGAPQPTVLGIPTALKVGTLAGTVPLALRQGAAESATPTLAWLETGSGDLGYLGADLNTFVVGAATNKKLSLRTNLSTNGILIDINGKVGIGTTSPVATLNVRGPDTNRNTLAFSVEKSSGSVGLQVWDDGTVGIGAEDGFSTVHACYSNSFRFGGCSSAAEYVPTIDNGAGFPETADLVSIAPAVTNPYGDAHEPFTVQKSTMSCDPNLLGFIVKPESGADGKKLNDHYLPLAIYGYFPAKVTLENGSIKRGDPITSSSKPGYGMKATQACKIIGYALEDTDKEGTIQVFAHLSESAAPEVTALRVQMQALERTRAKETEELRQRIATLEKLVQVLSKR